MKIFTFCLRFSVGWLGWLRCWFFELIVFSVSCLSSWYVVSGWLVGLVGLKFLFENFQFLPQVLSWLVGLVGLLVFLSWFLVSVSCFSSWFVVLGWLVGLIGVEVSL